MPTGRQRERERRDTPLPAQENHFRGAHRRRITGHRPGDQRHPDGTPWPQNTQRGLAGGNHATIIATNQHNKKCCTHKLNTGFIVTNGTQWYN